MMPAQLKETTMDPAKRTLLRVTLLADDREGTADSVERLMGTRADGHQGRGAVRLHLRQGGICQRGSAGRVAPRPVCRHCRKLSGWPRTSGSELCTCTRWRCSSS